MARQDGARAPQTPETVQSSRNGGSNGNGGGGDKGFTVNHVTSNSRSSTILGMTKPALALVSLLMLGSFLWGWLTIPGLYEQIEELEAQVDRLAGEVNRFEVLNDQLNSTVKELLVINEDLNETAKDLRDSVDDLQHENNRLTKLNDNLENIVGFLNETTVEIGETLDDVTEHLAEQITASRVVVMETLENTYRQNMDSWDCAYRDIFRGLPFIVDEFTTPIGLIDLPGVLDYVEDRVLSEMCASRSEFESFLEQRYSLTSMTSEDLRQGVALFTTNLFNYYFPDPGQEGLTPEEWAAADYSCLNVPPFTAS